MDGRNETIEANIPKSELKTTKGDHDRAKEKGIPVEDEVLRRVLIKNLSQLFKKDVLEGPVYTLELLKKLHLEHIGYVPEVK